MLIRFANRINLSTIKIRYGKESETEEMPQIQGAFGLMTRWHDFPT